MFLKKIVSSILFCSLGCTCLVTNAFAEVIGGEPPCHHLEMEEGANESPQEKNCCLEKIEAWREAAEQNDAQGAEEESSFQKAYFYAQVSQENQYRKRIHWYRPRPPAHISNWNTVRLLL